MQPTNKLRWASRTRINENYPRGEIIGQTYRVLQQWWEEEHETLYVMSSGTAKTERSGEWRDIPIEVEE